jgi:hypothetical protein
MDLLAVASALLLALPPVASGQVVGEDGAPVPGAEVCLFDTEGQRVDCVSTDAQGFYRLENPTLPNLLVQAPGFKAEAVLAAPQNQPVVLRRAVALTVRVVDAQTGQPIEKGTVTFHLPSGKNVGSEVPFNRSGVKVSNMSAGETMIRAHADGYVSGDPVVVNLTPGKPHDVVVKLRKEK